MSGHDNVKAAPGRWAAALTFAILLVLSSPYAGLARGWLRARYPHAFRWIVAVLLASAVMAVCKWSARQIRDRHGRRYAAIAFALLIAVVVARAFRSGVVDVDVVEDVHFVQYGALAFLLYRIWRDRGGAMPFVTAAAGALVVACADEWLQWFLPSRIGEIRDVFLDMAGVGCGLLFSAAILAPYQGTRRRDGRSPAAFTVLPAAALVSLAVFVWTIHVGTRVEDASLGSFLSRYGRDELLAASADRAARWSKDPPIAPSLWSREDQYLAEGIWHVALRNRAWSNGDIRTAWCENRILETYFAPVLDTPSSPSPVPPRWPEAQRRDAERRVRGGAGPPYVSTANVFPILPWR